MLNVKTSNTTMLKFDFRPIYAGEALQATQNLVNAEARVGEAYIKSAQSAQDKYDKILTYLSSINPVTDKGRDFIRQYGEDLNREIASIAKDAQGKIKWNEALSAVNQMGTKLITDSNLNELRNNAVKQVANNKMKMELASKGLPVIGFGIDNFEEITTDENGNVKVNPFKGFYEVKGQHQKAWEEGFNQLGTDFKTELRNIVSKPDRTDLENKYLENISNQIYNLGKEGGLGAAARQRIDQLMEQYGGDEERIKKHIIQNDFPFAIASKTEEEIKLGFAEKTGDLQFDNWKRRSDYSRNADVKAYEEKLRLQSQYNPKKDSSSGSSGSTDGSTPNYFSETVAGIVNVGNREYKIRDSDYDERGNIKKTIERGHSIDYDDYKTLKKDNPTEAAKYKEIKSNIGGPSQYVKYINIHQDLKDINNNIRINLLKDGYMGYTSAQIASMSDKEIEQIHQSVVDQANNEIFTIKIIDNPNILADKVNITKEQIPLNGSTWRLAGKGKDMKTLSEATNIKSSKDINSITFLGFSQLGQENNGLEPGAGIYKIIDTKGNEHIVARPSTEINNELTEIFRPISTFNDAISKIPITNSGSINAGNKAATLRMTDILNGLDKNYNYKSGFQTVAYTNEHGQFAAKAKPFIIINKKKFMLENLKPVLNESGVPEFVLKEESLNKIGASEFKELLKNPTVQKDIYRIYSEIHKAFGGNDINVSYNDIKRMTSNRLNSANFVRNSVQTATTVDKNLAGISQNDDDTLTFE